MKLWTFIKLSYCTTFFFLATLSVRIGFRRWRASYKIHMQQQNHETSPFGRKQKLCPPSARKKPRTLRKGRTGCLFYSNHHPLANNEPEMDRSIAGAADRRATYTPYWLRYVSSAVWTIQPTDRPTDRCQMGQ